MLNLLRSLLHWEYSEGIHIKFLTAPFLIIGSLGLVVSCGDSSSLNPEPPIVKLEVSCQQFTADHDIQETIQIREDQTLEVLLCSNPTTGFRWSENAEISNPDVLRQEFQTFIEPDPSVMPGEPGQQLWQFKALDRGQSTLFLGYSQPFGEQNAWTFTLDVTVN